ncbi:Pimeloyl-ACP methyl ester carboxylesterase [Fictibacillus enclensis]|uniref:Acetoin dehydrogenase n=1 Tax=Fictibacillus enclensis TaxID=1017270 RepID=A0A0V8J8M2_9BACL|nr:alpha/beta hydrolase [Fictibacillus enclensis]KSU83538.1 acetoin dehydrogenase [Fictibacillus enclensis]SCC17085.1 Pimeloyl-ACP methyl ester carboxylesterase [Fictibacillus enclensis]
MQLKQLSLGTRTMQYADYPGSKGTIIAIHGLTGNHKQMHYYAEKLKGDYRVIAVDLRGRGNSSAADENTSLFQHAEDIITLIKELKIEEPLLLGYSMGAFISAVVASEMEDVKGVILLDGAAACTQQQRDIVQPSLSRLSKTYETQEQYIKELKEIYGRLGVTWTDHLKSVAEYETHEVNGHWENKSSEVAIESDFNSFYSFVPEEICSKVTCPVLLVHASGAIGTFPPLFYAEAYDETRKHIEDLENVTSDCNHYTMVFENREEINKAILTFLTKIASKVHNQLL